MTSSQPLLPPSLTLRGVTFSPPLFCAPMAGITHSAFRRLLADYGGGGALWTEMISAKTILHEDVHGSPWLKRRPQEDKVIYQLLVVDTDRLEAALDRLAVVQPDGIDLNVACPAPNIRRQRGGAHLFEDGERLRDILRMLRRHVSGPLTVKTRLGRETPDWRAMFQERLRLMEDEGVDALILHPRFAGEKLKRSARHALLPELAATTRLPIIANGDITGPDFVRDHATQLAPAAGLMVGRLVAAQPWLLAKWRQPDLVVDTLEVWQRLCAYIIEDFPEHQALARIKIIAPYFARNFLFGHTFFSKVQSSPDLATVLARSTAFLSSSPEPAGHVTVDGI